VTLAQTEGMVQVEPGIA
jgi:hypothetical protein